MDTVDLGGYTIYITTGTVQIFWFCAIVFVILLFVVAFSHWYRKETKGGGW